MGGSSGLLGFRTSYILTVDNTHLKFFCLFLCATKAYQATPLRGLPHSLGMWRWQAVALVEIRQLQSHQSSRMLQCCGFSSKWPSSSPKSSEFMRSKVTRPTIKAIHWVLYDYVPITRARSLGSSTCWNQLSPIINGEGMGVGGLYLRPNQVLYHVAPLC
jgi:hypothetical protein